MKYDEPFDRLLDEALKSYAAVEPRPGLEQRVVANLRSAAAPVHHGWLRWAAVAAACLAVALAALLAYRPSVQPRVVTRAPQTQATLPAVKPVVRELSAKPPRTLRPRPRVVIAGKVAPAQAPILAGPLSSEELALLAFVRESPRTAAAVAKQQSEPDQPATVPQIQVSALVVQPVEVAPLEK